MQHLKIKIENYQIYIYFTVILLAIIIGLTSDHLTKLLESVIPNFIKFHTHPYLRIWFNSVIQYYFPCYIDRFNARIVNTLY